MNSVLASVPTGRIIKEYLDSYDITQKELSQRTGISEKHLSHVLNGTSRLTEETALRLEKVLSGVPASYWLNYESKYREAVAREQSPVYSADPKELRLIAKRFKFSESSMDLDGASKNKPIKCFHCCRLVISLNLRGSMQRWLSHVCKMGTHSKQSQFG